jgi:pilus assembly protein CpaE
MPELSVVAILNDEEQKPLFQVLVDGTSVACLTHAFAQYPQMEGDPIVRRIQDLKPDVILVDLAEKALPAALRAVEVFQAACNKSVVFALGDMNQPQLILAAMRAGAREFMPRPANSDHLLEALNRFVTSQRKLRAPGKRGRVFSVLNAKGGNGATTVAVNTALSLATTAGSTALIDMAPLGNAALHLNLKTGFTALDALSNLHRLDATLLDGFMARHETGLHVLAGNPGVNLTTTGASDFARLFDVLVNQYRYVVVDLSTRVDLTARALCDLSDDVLLVANPDLSSLWSAARIREFLAGSSGEQKLRLVMNRYRKIAGFGDSDIEDATRTRILCKIPNQYAAVMGGIERGVPVVHQNHSEIARCFVDFSKILTSGEQASKSKSWLFR